MLRHFLDQPNSYSKKDPSDVYQSITLLADQYLSAWKAIEDLKLVRPYKEIKNICYSGMGGSGLSGRIVRSLSPYLLSLPLEVSTNYRLPASVDKNTLVIIASYSGNTEETISALKDALNRQAQIFIFAVGGELIKLAEDYELNYYKIDPQFNPCGAPRLGLGYSVGATLSLLVKLKLSPRQIIDNDLIVQTIRSTIENLNKDVEIKHNPAKLMATQNKGKAVFIISANHLDGVAHTSKNLINETAKTFAAYFDLPELNHHLMEGLLYPEALRNQSTFILLNSDNYPKLISKRLKLTKEVIDRQKYPTIVIKTDAADPFAEVFESITFFYFFSYYLGLVNGVDPGQIPWVDYFKKRLKDI